MNSAIHKPLALETTPLAASLPDSNLFVLRMRYRQQGHWQTFVNVHVPVEMQQALAAGDVEAIHLEALEVNGHPQHSVTGRPDYLVVGLLTRGGQDLREVPGSFLRARRRFLVRGGGAVLAGAALLLSPLAWLGALVFAFGTHELRTAGQFRCRPFSATDVVS
jgi:hypothetical protein